MNKLIAKLFIALTVITIGIGRAQAQTLEEFRPVSFDSYRSLMDIVPYKGQLIIGEYYHGPFGSEGYFENASSRVLFINTDGTLDKAVEMPGLGSAISTIAPDEEHDRIWVAQVVPPEGSSSTQPGVRVSYISALNEDGTVVDYSLAEQGSTRAAWIDSLVIGPDGNVWFVDYSAHRIGKLNPSTSAITYYQLRTASWPSQIIVGPDNALWFSEWGGVGIGKLGRITTAGSVTEYSIPGIVAGCGPRAIVADSTSIWIASGCYNNPSSSRLDVATKAITSIPLTPAYNRPTSIATTGDGRAWVGTLGPGVSGITAETEFAQTRTASGVLNLVTAQDGRIWGLEYESRVLRLTVPGGVSITTEELEDGRVKSVYSANLSADGGTAPYNWVVSSGSLPPGMSLSAAGVISGTPTTEGEFTFSVKVSDANLLSDSRSFSMTIESNGPRIVTQNLASIIWKTKVHLKLEAIGGSAPYKFSISSGALPQGLTLSKSGFINGTAKQGGTFTFGIRVTDKLRAISSEKVFTLYVSDLAIGAKNVEWTLSTAAQQKSLLATGGRPAYSWSVASGTLPGTLTLAADGTVSGVWAKVGTRKPAPVKVVLRVQDSLGFSVTQTVTLKGK